MREVADAVAVFAGVGWPGGEASCGPLVCECEVGEAPSSEWVSSKPTAAARMIRAEGSAMIAALRRRWARAQPRLARPETIGGGLVPLAG